MHCKFLEILLVILLLICVYVSIRDFKFYNPSKNQQKKSVKGDHETETKGDDNDREKDSEKIQRDGDHSGDNRKSENEASASNR